MFLSSENKGKHARKAATFRSYLNSMGYNGFLCYPSFNHSLTEACSQDRIESCQITDLHPLKRFFVTSILSESETYNLILKAEFLCLIN